MKIPRVIIDTTLILGSLQRITHLNPDTHGHKLYEHLPLMSWSCMPWTHLNLLEKFQDYANCIISQTWLDSPRFKKDAFQNRWEMAGFTILYKTLQDNVPHLTSLKQHCRTGHYPTRATLIMFTRYWWVFHKKDTVPKEYCIWIL